MHFDSIWENAVSCAMHFWDLGHNETPQKLNYKPADTDNNNNYKKIK